MNALTASHGLSGTPSPFDPPAPGAVELPLDVPLRLLRAAEAVARHGSVGGAATELHLSNSAVSRAVAHAERLLGCALFDRSACGMVCTPQAAPLLRHVARARQHLAAPFGALLARRINDAMLRALATVAWQRSETGAARSLGLTQAAVHQTLCQLEHAARVPLFDRSRRGTLLTEQGQRLLQHAQLAMAELRRGLAGLSAGRARERLALGVLPMASDVLVAHTLGRLATQRPGSQVTVFDGTYAALIDSMRHGDIDLVLGPLRQRQAPTDIEELPVFDDSPVVVARHSHPALRQSAVLTLADLSPWPWVAPLRGSTAERVYEQAFESHGIAPPDAVLRANSAAVVRSMLLASDAIALLSPLQVRADLLSGALVALPVPLRQAARRVGVMHRAHVPLSEPCEAFIGALHALVRDLDLVGALR